RDLASVGLEPGARALGVGSELRARGGDLAIGLGARGGDRLLTRGGRRFTARLDDAVALGVRLPNSLLVLCKLAVDRGERRPGAARRARRQPLALAEDIGDRLEQDPIQDRNEDEEQDENEEQGAVGRQNARAALRQGCDRIYWDQTALS